MDVSQGIALKASSRRGLAALLEAMRPTHWIKNAFVVAPLLFSGRFVQLEAWGQSLAAVVIFCLLSSGAYLLNDVCDRPADGAHPLKRLRAVASGRLSPAAALAASLVLLAGGMVLAMVCARWTAETAPAGLALVVWSGSYLILNLLYSFWLKAHPIVDVIAVALGFVLRAMAGAAAIAVPVSPWLVVCTLTLCLFIALTKRRAEIDALGADAGVRPANAAYDPADLNVMIAISAAMAIITYSLYCLAPRTMARIGSAHMVWTIPLVVYGVFRFNRLTRVSQGREPVGVLVRDRAMWAVVLLYTILAALIVKFGSHESLREILEVRPPAS